MSSTSTTTTTSSSNTYSILSAIGRMSHAEQGIRSFPSPPSSPLQRGTAMGAGDSTAALQAELEEREANYIAAWRQAGGGTLRSPSTGITSTTWYLGPMLEDIEERREALGLPPFTYPPSEVHVAYGQPIQYLTPTHLLDGDSNIPPPPPLRRVNGFTSSTTSSSVVRNLFPATDEDDLMDRLRTYRSELQVTQDDLYEGVSHDDEDTINALNEQSEEISRKIQAIEQCMLSFGAIFRNR